MKIWGGEGRGESEGEWGWTKVSHPAPPCHGGSPVAASLWVQGVNQGLGEAESSAQIEQGVFLGLIFCVVLEVGSE